MRHTLSLFPLLVACAGAPSPSAPVPGTLTVLHTSRMEGEIEPCG